MQDGGDVTGVISGFDRLRLPFEFAQGLEPVEMARESAVALPIELHEALHLRSAGAPERLRRLGDGPE